MDKKFEAPVFEVVNGIAEPNRFLVFSGISAFSWSPIENSGDDPFNFNPSSSGS